MKTPQESLLVKLLLVTLVPAITIILVIWLAIDKQAAGYFMALMKKYEISPTEIHQMFLSSIHFSLIWASLVALVLSFVLSFLLIRRVLKPLSQMTTITDQVADGNFSTRVDITTRDEVGRLGISFNHMADSLARIEQLRRNMVADVAHELRTPLTNLRGYLEALNDGVLEPSPKTLGILEEETMRLVKLVENLQRLARADAARYYLDLEIISIAKEIDYLLTLYRTTLHSKDISLTTSFPAAADTVKVDRDKFLQAVSNLLDNCLKYTPQNGRIDISSRRTSGAVEISICNTGPEISADDLPFIFERFFRTDRSRSRDGGGAGIGLAITRELIEAHGGRVFADSSNGRTCISLHLPR
ncbi:sensor histidine kinase [Desulforhopalus singaporensis]|uniref:histidine kinase n=1 Tax=Desulforhopalus singaporensis TaxID=91360 RepID=A0A1H0SU17_9BACT|nr:ATP-binding protein [Desulforhopalus singaporensis]SDP45069.1 two-component system, OmpR family, sensor histidine kinase BaeS [Desulforhopalus singaporensis]